MKKLLYLVLTLLCMAAFVSCKQDNGEELDFSPAYFTGEVMEIYEESILVKIIDKGNSSFFDEQVHVRDVNAKANYTVGDQLKILYGGIFPQFDPPQVGAESIVKIDSEGKEIPTDEEPVMVGGSLIPSICVNDTVYTSAYHVACCTELSENCIYLGEVTECVGSSNVPTENFHANYAPVGAEVYQYYSVIYVKQNGVYCPYTAAEEPNFFAYDKSMEAYLVQDQFAEETGDLLSAKTPIAMTEEETQILLDLLEPYADTLDGDVLKSDYLRYYSIEIDDRMTLTIDPELGNYGENGDSYMLVMEHRPGAFIKGTYIDAELVEFLRARLAEEG